MPTVTARRRVHPPSALSRVAGAAARYLTGRRAVRPGLVLQAFSRVVWGELLARYSPTPSRDTALPAAKTRQMTRYDLIGLSSPLWRRYEHLRALEAFTPQHWRLVLVREHGSGDRESRAKCGYCAWHWSREAGSSGVPLSYAFQSAPLGPVASSVGVVPYLSVGRRTARRGRRIHAAPATSAPVTSRGRGAGGEVSFIRCMHGGDADAIQIFEGGLCRVVDQRMSCREGRAR